MNKILLVTHIILRFVRRSKYIRSKSKELAGECAAHDVFALSHGDLKFIETQITQTHRFSGKRLL